MATLVRSPAVIDAAGHPPKRIEEYVGRVATGCDAISVARMVSPAGWAEPGQTPEFDEITLVLAGEVTAELDADIIVVAEGQALLVRAGEWVRYSTPGAVGAQYVSICLPAFAPDRVHRDEAPARKPTRDAMHPAPAAAGGAAEPRAHRPAARGRGARERREA